MTHAITVAARLAGLRPSLELHLLPGSGAPRRPRPRSVRSPSPPWVSSAPTWPSSARTGSRVGHGLSTPDHGEAAAKRAIVRAGRTGGRPRRRRQAGRGQHGPVRRPRRRRRAGHRQPGDPRAAGASGGGRAGDRRRLTTGAGSGEPDHQVCPVAGAADELGVRLVRGGDPGGGGLGGPAVGDVTSDQPGDSQGSSTSTYQTWSTSSRIPDQPGSSSSR